MKASAWLAKHAPVEQMTWAPGWPPLIRDRLINDGGWTHRKGVTTFNLYRPPTLIHGDPALAEPWINHVENIYPNDADRIIYFLAHRVQRPHEKINHGLLLGGPPGIGKDTLLEPVKYGVGPWNFKEVSPTQAMGTLHRVPQERRAPDHRSQGPGRLRPLQILRPHESCPGRAARCAQS